MPILTDGIETTGDIPAGASVVIPPNKIAKPENAADAAIQDQYTKDWRDGKLKAEEAKK